MGYNVIPADLNLLSNKIIGLAIKVHIKLGPGLLESTYKECLYYEINKDGFKVAKEKPIPLIYESVKLDLGYRVDLLVENKLIIEIKAIEDFMTSREESIDYDSLHCSLIVGSETQDVNTSCQA